jgi:hypothetical protein
LYEKRSLPLQTIQQLEERTSYSHLEYGLYYIRPPVCEKLHPSDDNDYGNATSIMFYYRHGQNSILFPGDMTPLGMEHVLGEKVGTEKRFTRFDRAEAKKHRDWHTTTGDQPSLKHQLATYGLGVLVAPHHGLESCYSPELYDSIKGKKPHFVVISERRKRHDNDGNTDRRYYGDAAGLGCTIELDGKQEKKTSLSTKGAHHILIVFTGSGPPQIYANQSPKVLLSKLS